MDARYHEIFEEYSKHGRHPYAEFILGMDHTFAQSDNTNHMMTMKVSFREAARGGERRIRVRLKDQCPICSGKNFTDYIDHKMSQCFLTETIGT